MRVDQAALEILEDRFIITADGEALLRRLQKRPEITRTGVRTPGSETNKVHQYQDKKPGNM